MKIKVIKVEVENKGKYNQATVAYNDLEKGKIGQKKIMSFTFKDVYNALKDAKDGDVFQVSLKKNEESGYWDWVEVSKDDGTPTNETGSTAGSKSFSSPRSTYETPEERAKKQVYIVRQSSLNTAVQTLAVGEKGKLNPDAVLELARKYSDFVLGADPASAFADLNSDLPEDIEVS